MDFIQTVMERPVHLPSDLKDAAETICATSWNEVGSQAHGGGEGCFAWRIPQALRAALRGAWVSLHPPIPCRMERVGDGSHMGPKEAQEGMSRTLASQLQSPSF